MSTFYVSNKTNHPMSNNSHPSAIANKAKHCLKWEEAQQAEEHRISLTKYETVAPDGRFRKLFLFHFDKSQNSM